MVRVSFVKRKSKHMMKNDRLITLLEMETNDNQDATLKYMIALEYKKIEDSKCEDYFHLLKKDFSDYLGTYYTAGEYFYNKEEYETSKTYLKQGLLVAEKVGNKKTYDEIKNLLFNVEMEE